MLNPPDHSPSALEQSIADMLEALGVTDNPEIVGTPSRVAEFWRENLLSGYETDPASLFLDYIEDTNGAIVSLLGIPFHGVCPHHLVPYFGQVDIGYDPNGRIVGLGTIEKLVATLSRRLALQEELTTAISDALMKHLNAQGACVRITAQHLCFMLRGREPRGTRIVTHASQGTLQNRYEFLATRSTVHESME
ncbi:MAG: GTP cyclohydrolase I [Myxococcota bacterium]|nr:GTP cyclohydrolase I [Myxococcota bacterium]